MSDTQQAGWIAEEEIENAQIKWAYSHFDGREDTYNAEGDHNFTIIVDQDKAEQLAAAGWTIKENAPMEEGDPVEYLLKAKISFKFDPPKIYFIKNGRKFRVDQRDLVDIRRSATENVDVILVPSRWTNGPRSGVTAYVKELYVTIKESRFGEKYADLEEV